MTNSLQGAYKTTIVTVTYNASNFIERFATSVCKVLLKASDLNLVVVDNGSTDDTVAKLESTFTHFGVQARTCIVESEQNLGFGKGCNLGAEHAAKSSSEFIWFLNPDTEIELSSYESLVACFSGNATADFVGSVLKNELGELRSGAFRFPGVVTTFLSRARIGVLDKVFSRFTNTIPLATHPVCADWLTGASFMVKRSVFESLAGFDPAYFLYFEEVDLFVRASRSGHRSFVCSQSQVFHESGASTGINKKDSTEMKPRPSYWFESRRYFYWSRYGRAYFLMVDCAFMLGSLCGWVKNTVKRDLIQEPPLLVQGIFRYSGLFGKKPSGM